MRQLLDTPNAVGVYSVLPSGLDPSQLGNQVAWYINRTDKLTLSGNALTTWIDSFGLSNDLTQATAANKPLALIWDSTYRNYAYLPGIAGNYISTPDSVALSITGDIDIRCLCAPADWAGGPYTFIGKFDAAPNKSWFFEIRAGGLLSFTWSEAGTMLKSATSAVPVSFTGSNAGGVRVTLDVDDGANGFLVSFYESTDGGSNWTLLDTQVPYLGTTSIFDSTADLWIGATQSGLTTIFSGKIYAISVRSGIGGSGTLVANYNADKGTSYTDLLTASTGEVWTLSRDAATTGYKALLVDENMVMFDGSDWLKKAIASLAQPCTIYLMAIQLAWASNRGIFDGNTINTGALQESPSTPNVRIFAGGSGVGNANWAVNTWRILTAIFNGASSFIKVDQTADAGTTGNAGSAAMAGFTLGARGDNSSPSLIVVKECIIYGAAHDSATRAAVRTNMAGRHKYTLV